MTPKWSEYPSNCYRESFSRESGECKSSLTDIVPSSGSLLALPAVNGMCSLSAQKKDSHVYKRRKMDKDSNSILADEEVKETTTRSCTTSEDHSPILQNLSGPSPVIPSDIAISNFSASNADPILEYEEPVETSLDDIQKASLEPHSVVNIKWSLSSMPSVMMLEKKDTAECSSSNISPTEPITEQTSARDLCIAVLRKDGLLSGSGSRSATEALHDDDANCLMACKTCGNLEHPLKMLICDSCDTAFHLSCCIPRNKELPTDEWYCLLCLREKPKSLYGMSLDGKGKSSWHINQRPHGVSHIEYMLKDTDSYVTGVRIGRDFQADVPEWSGPTSRPQIPPLAPPAGATPVEVVATEAVVTSTEREAAGDVVEVEAVAAVAAAAFLKSSGDSATITVGLTKMAHREALPSTQERGARPPGVLALGAPTTQRKVSSEGDPLPGWCVCEETKSWDSIPIGELGLVQLLQYASWKEHRLCFPHEEGELHPRIQELEEQLAVHTRQYDECYALLKQQLECFRRSLLDLTEVNTKYAVVEEERAKLCSRVQQMEPQLEAA